ncbi:efflux RND transporter permease subunit [Lentilactobacillus kisonensis]|uniref:efflux RND transporter permease subunit n=1 Tax=Lentilactobacillus kisonensis TaxID=481722 RepID=UPI0006D184BB|nr:efflux RND transporter permease subunit [Lentilactobacillus kisonensis]
MTVGHHKASIAGQPAIGGTVGKQMTKSMAIMLVAAVIIMFVILLIVFPVRRRLLPLIFVLIGMIWTFGFMGWLGIDLTMATMATLPILIGLGTDFGVQFLNRYEEEYKNNGQNTTQAITTTAGHSGMAVGIASIVMILSFLTMLISKAPMLQYFGITLAIGVLMCYIVEFALTFATVALLDQRQNFKQTAKLNTNNSWLNNTLANYAKWVMKHAGVITVIGVLIGGIGFFFESHISIETNLIKMIPQDLPA